jgi:transcriptional regulator with XRE-family HTH domain
MPRVNGEMIVIGRESPEMTQDHLARLLGIAQATLSKYETGALVVSDEHLAALSRALAYPEEFLARKIKCDGPAVDACTTASANRWPRLSTSDCWRG